jgi:hypothetical protein
VGRFYETTKTNPKRERKFTLRDDKQNTAVPPKLTYKKSAFHVPTYVLHFYGRSTRRLLLTWLYTAARSFALISPFLSPPVLQSHRLQLSETKRDAKVLLLIIGLHLIFYMLSLFSI